MRYNERTKCLQIGVREFVTLARRGISESLPLFEDEPALDVADRLAYEEALKDTSEETCELTFPLGDVPCTLTAKVTTDAGGALFVPAFCDGDPNHPPKALASEVRGEAYVRAYVYMEHAGRENVRIAFSYRNPKRNQVRDVTENLTHAKAQKFFEKCACAVTLFAAPAVERATERLPSMKTVKFPYAETREGQDMLLHAVYRNIVRGTALLAEAPTGTGKTVAALYPAIRAMGEEKCEKVFYLTSKGTTAKAAEECLKLLSDAGAKIRAVRIYAKEVACEGGVVCRENRKACPHLSHNTLPDAVRALWKRDERIVGLRELRETARAFGVCPHELSLAYAEIADVVICDMNYLFDPAVYLRRFFDMGGEYVFLIDEAHNVPDRVAAAYSDELTPEEVGAIAETLPEHSSLREAALGAKESFEAILHSLIKGEERTDANGEPFAFVHGKTLPQRLYEWCDGLLGVVEEELFRTYGARDEERDARLSALNRYYYRLRGFATTLSLFDEKYEYFCKLELSKLSIKLFCIDPGKVISERVRRGRCAVWFSATFSPLTYYREVLGADRTAECISAPSPFERGQLSVSVMDKISTRFTERASSLSDVLRVIACTVSAKCGHYIVFAPSFSYVSMLASGFRAKYPKIHTLEQKREQTAKDREAFLSSLAAEDGRYLVAFCVTGGVYSEGIDLPGNQLIGAVIVGVGFPAVCPEREAVSAYFDEKFEAGKQYSYIYPGMNKVLQAAGRVIRREEDRGVIVLIDDRFADPVYKKSIPDLWHGLKFVADVKGLKMLLDKFWAE